MAYVQTDDNGRVTQVRRADLAETTGWLEAPNWVVVGCAYDGSDFYLPPSPHHYWDGSQWVEDTSTIRQSKVTEAAAERDRRVFKGIVRDIKGDGTNVHYSTSERGQIATDAAARDAEKRGITRRWKAAGPSTGEAVHLDLSASELDTLHAEMADHVQAHYDAEEALADTIAGASDPASIDVTADKHWP